MMKDRKSPLTGHVVPFKEHFDRDIQEYNDFCGRWAVTAEALWSGSSVNGGKLRLESRTLSENETRQTFAMAKSEVWRINKEENVIPLFMNLNSVAKMTGDPPSGMKIVTLEELSQLAFSLSLDSKAMRTLQNLAIAESEVGAGMEVPYHLQSYPGSPIWMPQAPSLENGISYGCTYSEAPLVYDLLRENAFVRVRQPNKPNRGMGVYITAKGYARIAKMSTGSASESIECFFVCRFIPEMDMLFDEVISPLGEEIGVRIRRIKDIHHIDKIDDRICREIGNSVIVLVDLSEQNFNVAFEAGYALALGKPIVWTMKKTTEGVKMPFDVYTYNCLAWDSDDLEAFRESLKYRMLAAIEKSQRVMRNGVREA